jgi:hypothetical protein
MPFHVYRVRCEGQPPQWCGIRIEFDDDRWVATPEAVDAEGNELSDGAVGTTKFYGVTPEQAHRRLLDTLEQVYDEVVPARTGP